MEGNNIFVLEKLAGLMHKKLGAIHFICANLMTNFSILPTSPSACTCTHLEYPYLLISSI